MRLRLNTTLALSLVVAHLTPTLARPAFTLSTIATTSQVVLPRTADLHIRQAPKSPAAPTSTATISHKPSMNVNPTTTERITATTSDSISFSPTSTEGITTTTLDSISFSPTSTEGITATASDSTSFSPTATEGITATASDSTSFSPTATEGITATTSDSISFNPTTVTDSPTTESIPPTSTTSFISSSTSPTPASPPPSFPPTSSGPTSTSLPSNLPPISSPSPQPPQSSSSSSSANQTPTPTPPTGTSTRSTSATGSSATTRTGSLLTTTISGTGLPLPPNSTSTVFPNGTVTPTPVPAGSSSNKLIIIGVAVGVLFLLTLICFFVYRRRVRNKKRERLYRSSDGLNSQISINRGSRDGDDDGESVAQSIDNDDLDSEKAFFMANPPGRIRSPQLAHADSHDLNIKTPVEQYEAQKFNWSEPIEISNRHPQNHVRQQQLQRLLELQKEHSQKLNDLVEKYRVQHSRPQSPHSPVLTETRLSTRLSLFGLDGEPLEEEALSSSEIRQLEVKGDGRPELKDAPPFLEEGPFRDHEEVDDDDVELQRLEIYHGPFEDPDDNDCNNRTQSVDMFQDQDEEYDPFEHVGLNDDAIAIAEADFEVASIIRSESGSLTATEFEDRKGKSVQRDSDYSYMGGVSSSSVNDDFRTGFSQRDSDISFLAASSTIGARESYSIRDSDSFMGVTTSAEYGGVGESSSGSGSARSSGIPVALDLERQREREESNILLKAIAAMKAQYDEQYRLIHEGLTGLQLE